MQQAKFSLAPSQIELLEQHRDFGFRDKSEMVRAALERMKQEREREQLQESATLYSLVYEGDEPTREWTEDSTSSWPE